MPLDNLCGTLEDSKVIVLDEAKANRLYNKGYYGIPLSGGGLELDLYEARYLMETERLEVMDGSGEKVTPSTLIERSLSLDSRSTLIYPVYSDMRQRGYVLKDASSPADFRVFPRGGGPGKTPTKYWLIVSAETDRFFLPETEEVCNRIMDLKKELLVATLDEEGDVTYHKISTIDLKGDDRTDCIKDTYEGVIYGDRCLMFDGGEINENHFFGRHIADGIQLSLVETQYLLEKGILTVFNGGTGDVMDLTEFHEYASKKQKDYPVRYTVYKDLRNKGVIPKTGFKYGTAFRCYLGDPEDHHADYIIQPVGEYFECSRYDTSRAVRVAHSVRKSFAFARSGKNGVTYTKMERETP